MRVLVTGAAGFIGSHIAETMREAGHEVRGLDSLTPAVHNGRPRMLLATVVGDVRDPAAVDEALAGVDAVCHQAAMVGLGVDLSDLPVYSDVNVTGTAVLLEAMGRHGIGAAGLRLLDGRVRRGRLRLRRRTAGCGRCPGTRPTWPRGCFEPRCPVCGSPLGTSTVGEEAPLDPRNAYAASKVAQEHLAASWARLTGGAAVGLRYHNVYGPRMPRDTPYSGVAAIFRSCLENGVPPRVFEDGGQRRDFVHVRDVARANLLALSAVRRGRAGDGLALLQRGQRGAAHGGRDGFARWPPAFGGIEPVVTGEYRLGDVRHIVASPEGAARDLGFRAQTRFAAGIAEFARAPLREPALARV